MPVKNNKQLAILRRRRAVADLYLQGWTQTGIAEELGVAQPTVCDDLRRIRAEWRDSAVRDFDEARQLELMKLDRIEREAWSAWQRSQKPAQSAVVTGEGVGQRTRKSMKNQHGECAFPGPGQQEVHHAPPGPVGPGRADATYGGRSR